MNTRENLKWPQIDAAFNYLIEHDYKYSIDIDKKHICPFGIIEFGVYNGGSLNKICARCDKQNMQPFILGYDSWEGLPKEDQGIPFFEKFKEGSYNTTTPDLHRSLQWYTPYNGNLFLRKCLFKDIPDTDAILFNKAILIHIDCDLYISTYQALDWCFKNDLITSNTLVAFDEFSSTLGHDGGEELAWKEIQNKYEFSAEEIFHYTYLDKDTAIPIRQNVMRVI